MLSLFVFPLFEVPTEKNWVQSRSPTVEQVSSCELIKIIGFAGNSDLVCDFVCEISTVRIIHRSEIPSLTILPLYKFYYYLKSDFLQYLISVYTLLKLLFRIVTCVILVNFEVVENCLTYYTSTQTLVMQ